MLKSDLLDNEYIIYFKSGFYIDYTIKKFAEIFLKNILVFTFLFFGEKFMIELLSKRVYSFFFFFCKKNFFFKSFCIKRFFFFCYFIYFLLISFFKFILYTIYITTIKYMFFFFEVFFKNYISNSNKTKNSFFFLKNFELFFLYLYFF